MEKLTLSIRKKENIDWVKKFARAHDTSVSSLFESYVDALRVFDQQEVKLSESLQALREPGKRPKPDEIQKHLTQRRYRSGTERD